MRESTKNKTEDLRQFIEGYFEANLHPPSCREMSKGVGASNSTLQILLQNLADEGLIERQPRRFRNVLPRRGDFWL